MKRARIYESIVIIMIIILICKSMFGQWSSLSLDTYNEDYTDLDSDQYVYYHSNIVLNSSSIPVGFNLGILTAHDRLSPDSLKINIDGFITLSEYMNGSHELFHAYGADFIDRGAGTGEPQSSISYLLEGNPGNRILKIQWKNMGFYKEYEILGTTDSYTNVQLWLYESQSCFEVRIGPTYISYSSRPHPAFEHGPMIGYYGVFWDQYQNPQLLVQLLSGDPVDPELGINWFLDSLPENGTVYNFHTGSIITTLPDKQEMARNIAAGPNPFSNTTNIRYEISKPGHIHLAIYNMNGKQVAILMDSYQASGKHQIRYDAANMPSGQYIAVLTTDENVQKTKMLITR